MRLSTILILCGTLISSIGLADDRGPAVQNPHHMYMELCTDPDLVEERNHHRLCNGWEGTVQVDLFNNDQSSVVFKGHRVKWHRFARGLVTKPFIPFELDMGEGHQLLDLGDVRWLHNGLGENTRMAIRVNDAGTVKKKGYRLVPGKTFTVFDTAITNLVVTGLSGDPVRLEVAIYSVDGAGSMYDADHHLTPCEGVLSPELKTTTCDGKSAKLLEYRVYEIGSWATRRTK